MEAKAVSSLHRWLAYITLTVVMLSAMTLGANRPVSWTLLSIVVFALFAIYVIFTRPPEFLNRALVPGILFLIVIIWGFVQTLGGMPSGLAHPFWSYVPDVSGHISADPGQGIHIVMRYMAYAMVFVIIATAAIDSAVASTLLRIIAIAATCYAVFGFYEYLSGSNPILGEAYETIYVSSMTSTFVNRNSFATFAVFGALANLTAYLQVSARPQSGQVGTLGAVRDTLESFYGGAWAYGLGLLLCIGAVSLTQSRAGALVGLVALIVFYFNWREKGKGSSTGMMIALGGIIAFVALTSASGLVQRLLTTKEDGRFQAYPQIIEGIGDRPILGHGLGAFQEAFRPYIGPDYSFGEWRMGHSSYLENIFEMGLPVAIAFYLALGLIIWQLWRGIKTRKRHREFAIFALACVAAGGLHSLVDFSLQMPATAALFAALLAIGWAQAFPSQQLKTQKSGKGSRRRSK